MLVPPNIESIDLFRIVTSLRQFRLFIEISYIFWNQHCDHEIGRRQKKNYKPRTNSVRDLLTVKRQEKHKTQDEKRRRKKQQQRSNRSITISPGNSIESTYLHTVLRDTEIDVCEC